MRMLLIAVLLGLTGCTTTDAIQGQIADRGAAISDEALQSAEFVMCRGITVGSWRRAYGTNPEKAAAWRKLCSDVVEQTP